MNHITIYVPHYFQLVCLQLESVISVMRDQVKVCPIVDHCHWAVSSSLSLSLSLSTDGFICHQHGRHVLHDEQINVTEPTYIQCSAPKKQFQTIGRAANSAQLPVLQPKRNGKTAHHHLLIPLKCGCMDSIDTMVLTGIRNGDNNTFPPFNFHVKWDCCPGKKFDFCTSFKAVRPFMNFVCVCVCVCVA